MQCLNLRIYVLDDGNFGLFLHLPAIYRPVAFLAGCCLSRILPAVLCLKFLLVQNSRPRQLHLVIALVFSLPAIYRRNSQLDHLALHRVANQSALQWCLVWTALIEVLIL